MSTQLKRRLRIPIHYLGLPFREYFFFLFHSFKQVRQPSVGFEALWQGQFPGRQKIPVSLGRHALWYFLEASGLEPGDEVLVAAYNYYVIVRLIVQKRLVPVFVDVEEKTLCLDKSDLARKITSKSRLVVVTHIYGHPADMTAIHSICQERKILLFEDCAHGIGTTHRDRWVGSFGDGALFSFGINKLVSALGGGMLVVQPTYTNLTGIEEKRWNSLSAIVSVMSRALVAYQMKPGVYGWTNELALNVAVYLERWGFDWFRNLLTPMKDNSRYRFSVYHGPGYRNFMTNMLKPQIERLGDQINRRREILKNIEDRLESIVGVELVERDTHGRSNASYFVIRVARPETMARKFLQLGIGCHPHEFLDCSQLRQFSDFSNYCPVAFEADKHVLRLPIYAEMKEEAIAALCSAVAEHIDE